METLDRFGSRNSSQKGVGQTQEKEKGENNREEGSGMDQGNGQACDSDLCQATNSRIAIGLE